MGQVTGGLLGSVLVSLAATLPQTSEAARSSMEMQSCGVTCHQVEQLLVKAGSELAGFEGVSELSAEQLDRAQSSVRNYCARLAQGMGGRDPAQDAELCSRVAGSTEIIAQCVAFQKTEAGSKGQEANLWLLGLDAAIGSVCLADCLAEVTGGVACKVAASAGFLGEGVAVLDILSNEDGYLTSDPITGSQKVARAISSIGGPIAAAAGTAVALSEKACGATGVFYALAGVRIANIYALQTTAEEACGEIQKLASSNPAIEASAPGSSHHASAGDAAGASQWGGGYSGSSVSSGNSRSSSPGPGASGSITGSELSQCLQSGGGCDGVSIPGLRGGLSNSALAMEKNFSRELDKNKALPPQMGIDEIRDLLRRGGSPREMAKVVFAGGRSSAKRDQMTSAVGDLAQTLLQDPEAFARLAKNMGLSLSTQSDAQATLMSARERGASIGSAGTGIIGGSAGLTLQDQPYASLWGNQAVQGTHSQFGQSSQTIAFADPYSVEDIWHSGGKRDLFQIVSHRYSRVKPRVMK